MPRKPKVPTEPKKHTNGQAYNKFRGEFYYHGKYGTQEAYDNFLEFRRQVQEAITEDTELTDVIKSEMTIAQASILYVDYCEDYHPKRPKGLSNEADAVRVTLKRLIASHGSQYLRTFGPADLKQFRESLVDEGLSRRYINACIGKVTRFVRWCVSEEYALPTQLVGLQSVQPLRKGKTRAREKPKPQAVSLETVARTISHMNRMHRSIVLFQLYCGLRPGEALSARIRDLDTSSSPWLYLPESHKNSWRDNHLIKGVPEIAQNAVQWLLYRRGGSLIFDSRLPYRGRLRASTGAPVQESPGLYTTPKYHRFVRRAVDRARKAGMDLEYWSPNQLRHSIATFVSNHLGAQTSSLWLGHADLKTTNIYLESQIEEIQKTTPQVNSLIQEHFPAELTKDYSSSSE